MRKTTLSPLNLLQRGFSKKNGIQIPEIRNSQCLFRVEI